MRPRVETNVTAAGRSTFLHNAFVSAGRSDMTCVIMARVAAIAKNGIRPLPRRISNQTTLMHDFLRQARSPSPRQLVRAGARFERGHVVELPGRTRHKRDAILC
jgi:hypothetical protein